MPENFNIEGIYRTTPVRPHPAVKIWKYRKERKKERYEAYKKRKKSKKSGRIDIYV